MYISSEIVGLLMQHLK